MAQAKIRMMAARRAGITSPPVKTITHTADQTFVNGAPVTLASAGTIQVVATSGLTRTASVSSANHYVTYAPDTTTLGVALGNAAGASADAIKIPVLEIMQGQQLCGNLVDTSASAATTSKVGVTVYLAKYAGYSSASSVVSADTHWGFCKTAPGSISSTSQNTNVIRGKIVGLVDAASTVNGRVLVDILHGGQFVPDQT